MTFYEAMAVARDGRRVRAVAWADRWLEYQPVAKWFMVYVHPITRVELARHIVRMAPECDPAWWRWEWTTDQIAPGDSPATLLTVYPWIEPLTIDFRGTIDGSDYIHIGEGRLWIVHRNWEPATGVQIRVNGGDWQPVEGGALELGIPTYGYDQMAFTPGIGRGTLTVDTPWAGDHGVILLDDDDPWSFPGADDYSFQVLLSWSGLTTPEPYIPAPEIPPVILPGDYFAVLRYRWEEDAGGDLDIGVSLLLPPATAGDGSSQIGFGWGGAYGPEDRPYLLWGGDSYSSGEREEDCAVDIPAIQEGTPGLASFRLEARGSWYGSVGTGQVQLTVDLYRGGSLEQTGGHFENPTGTLVRSVEQTVTLPGEGLLGYFDVTLSTMSVAFAPS